ncbi:MAG: NAD(P)H-dependent oxidoreductase [Bdellovibrio sp.]|nr:NAD(P)H-dependent oxidoreductase [Bdellovibrio sp.]
MTAPKILVLVGGISEGSLNEKLFNAIKVKHANDFSFEDFDIKSLPFFSQDLEADPPATVKALREKIKKADGILFITPEYNRSFPGVLKNAIDWGSRPYGQNSWDKKIAGVIGASVGNIGTFGAQHHLRQVLSYLNMHTMHQPELYLNASKAFDQDGNLSDSMVEEIIAKYMGAFKAWVTQNSFKN